MLGVVRKGALWMWYGVVVVWPPAPSRVLGEPGPGSHSGATPGLGVFIYGLYWLGTALWRAWTLVTTGEVHLPEKPKPSCGH